VSLGTNFSENQPRKVPAFAVLFMVALPVLIAVCAYRYRNVGGMLTALGLLLGTLAWRIAVLRSVLTVLASFSFALALAEFIVPMFDEKAPPNAIKVIEPPDYWLVTSYGAIGSKGSHQFKRIAPDGHVIYDTRYTIGDDGYRVTPDVPKSGDRIVFYGDSFTFGEGLKDDETMPYYVARLTGRPIKNYGFHGYGVHQALAILQSDRDTSGTVNFLLTAPWHAQRSACKVIFSAGSPKYEVTADGKVVDTGRCRMVTSFGPLGKIISMSNLYKRYLSTRPMEVTDADYDRYLALIGEMARISRERGQKFMIGFVRADENLFEGTHFSNEKILEKLRALGVEIVDLTLAARNEDLERKYYIDELDKHPSAEANRARAGILKDVFERNSK
jgi:hypothetical protein